MNCQQIDEKVSGHHSDRCSLLRFLQSRDIIRASATATVAVCDNKGNKVAKNKAVKHWVIDNPELSKAMHGLRSSSAASPHTPKSRKGTRAANSRRAIRENY